MSVHIPLTSTYAIRSDTYKWISAKSGNSKDGITWNGISFHRSLEALLKSYIEVQLRSIRRTAIIAKLIGWLQWPLRCCLRRYSNRIFTMTVMGKRG